MSDWLRALDRYGLAVMRGGPADEDGVVDARLDEDEGTRPGAGGEGPRPSAPPSAPEKGSGR